MSIEVEFPLQSIPRMRPGEHMRYVPNHRSFGAFMRSSQMRKVTVKVAIDIASMAATLTPSEKPGAKEHTGLHARVKSGFRVVPEAGLLKVGGNLRVKVEVVNAAEGSPWVEFGTRGVERQRPLGRAGAKFGDFKPDSGPYGGTR